MTDLSQLSGGTLVGVVIGGIIGFLIFAAIIALILGLINLIVNRFWPHYGRAFATVIVALIIGGIIDFIIGKLVGKDHFWALLLVGVIISTLVGGMVMNWFVRRQDGSPLGFKNAALAYLILSILLAALNFGLRPLMEKAQQMQAQQVAQAEQFQQHRRIRLKDI